MSFIPYQNYIGMAISIAGLALVAPISYYFRIYSRALEFAQLFYIFTMLFAVGMTTFSQNLGYSWISFIPSFLTNYCSNGDFLCSYGYLITPTIVLLGFILLMFIILKIVACKKPEVRYKPFYTFIKGLFRWMLLPLVYYSTDTLIVAIKNGISLSSSSFYDKNFIAAVVIDGFFVIWTLVELIGYSKLQKEGENNWKKWMQFLNTLKVMLIAALLVVGNRFNVIAYYIIYAPLVLYPLIYAFKYRFIFKCMERIEFLLGEAILITVFSLFLFKPTYITDNAIDFFALAIVLLLQIIFFIPKLYRYCKADGSDQIQSKVNPEDQYIPADDRKNQRKRLGNSFKNNQDFNADMSYEELKGSVSSPRKSKK